MMLYPASEWHRLDGVPVEIRHLGAVVRTGTVAAVMPDASMIWIAADGAYEREMFLAADNYEVWLEPGLLDGELRYRMTDDHLYPSRSRDRPQRRFTNTVPDYQVGG
ncbi:hypothetical protein ACPFL9_18545 [Paenarthrobacter sp. NyZ202]|uniref:hypothetical protein n=1 Tax=Paenarthrobacter sp. NyZ202 TaxID=3402689 RepID=UPI003CFA5B2C